MAFGMTYEQFWDGDVSAHRMFKKKYQIQTETERDNRNNAAWLHGMYVQRAIVAAFDGKKSSYPKEPIEIYSVEDEPNEEKRKQREDATMNRAKTNMEIFMVNFNKRMNAKLDGKEGVEVASNNPGN